jgi:hypothetical protein
MLLSVIVVEARGLSRRGKLLCPNPYCSLVYGSDARSQVPAFQQFERFLFPMTVVHTDQRDLYRPQYD